MNKIWQYIVDVFLLPVRTRKIMATLEEVQAQVMAAGVATDNIAADVQSLKDKLDAAIADTAGQVSAAVSAALQEVSDGLSPLVSQLEGVAASTPEDPEPEPV